MQTVHFDDAIDGIVHRDPRYHRDAYGFVRDALDYTQAAANQRANRRSADERQGGKLPTPPEPSHVSGEELLKGIRDFALDQFGPMAITVFEEWGIRNTRDFGEMVFNMIDASLLSKTEQDKREDFDDLYDFDAAFRTPFLPASKRREANANINQKPKKNS